MVSEITLDSSETVNTKYEDYYEDGSVFEYRNLSSVKKAENIIKACKNIPHDKILEVGCGDGAVLNRLSDLGFGKELYALEISPSAIKALENRGIKSLKEAKLYDGYNISYDSKTFDLVILTHVIEHVEHPRKLLYEASRVGKHLFVEVPLEDNTRYKEKKLFDEVGHINIYSSRTIRALLLTSDLDIVHSEICNISKDAYEFYDGKKGTLFYYATQIPFIISPAIATKLFTYHYFSLCKQRTDHNFPVSKQRKY